MLSIGVTGLNTTIVRDVSKILNAEPVRITDKEFTPNFTDMYVLTAGLLRNTHASNQSVEMMNESACVNLLTPIRICERILAANPVARICVIGSQSGVNGSYDMVYAACKAGLHMYVSTRKVLSRQLLACIIAPIISDAGMTIRRSDYPEILDKRNTVTTDHVAKLVVSILKNTGLLGRNYVVRI